MRLTKRLDDGVMGGTTWSLWADEPYDSAKLLRVHIPSRGEPSIGAGMNFGGEDGGVGFSLRCWRSIWARLPWVPTPKRLDEREVSWSLRWDTSMRLPGIWFHGSFFGDVWGNTGPRVCCDLLPNVAGAWQVQRDDLDTWIGEVTLPTDDGPRQFPVTVTTTRTTVRFARQFWTPALQWEAWVESAGEGWPTEEPHRRHKGPVFGSGFSIPEPMSAADAADYFARRYAAEVAKHTEIADVA